MLARSLGAAALAAPADPTLGPLGGAMAAQPTASLVTAGLLLGGAFGALAAYSLASLVRSKQKTPWVVGGAAALGALGGLEGYRQGQGLDQWLALHS
jgi:hypothetical protein